MKKQKVPDLEKYIEGKGRRFVSYRRGQADHNKRRR